MSTRAQWATDRLSAWLRETTNTDALDTLDEIRYAVEHWTECGGEDRTCAGITDECADSDPQDCKHCATECQDCIGYRKGTGSGRWATRPTLELIDALGALLERREDAAA